MAADGSLIIRGAASNVPLAASIWGFGALDEMESPSDYQCEVFSKTLCVDSMG